MSEPINEPTQESRTNPYAAPEGRIEETQASGEKKWPGWSAPLLGAFGGAIGGVFIAAEPRFPLTPVQSGLGGAALGALAGLVVWLKDRQGTAPNEAVPLSPPGDGVSRASRGPALRLLAFGLALVIINHMLVILVHKKFFAMAVGGPVLVGFGLAGCLHPSLLIGKGTGERPSLWSNLIAAVFGLVGLGLAGYLWFVIYR